MVPKRFWRRRGASAGTALLVALLVLRLAINVAAAGRYGFHREELVHMDMGQLLAWGYVGKPPGVAVAARASGVLGDSVAVCRVLPIAAGLVAAGLCLVLVRLMGGGRHAQVLALLSFVLWPVSLRASGILRPAAFDLAWGTLLFLLLVRAVHRSTPWRWLLWGAAWGLAVLTSYGTVLLGVASIIGLALSRERSLLRSPWPWLGLLCGLLVFSPHLVWLFSQGLATERVHAAARTLVGTHSRDLLSLLLTSLVTLPLVLAGLHRLLLSPSGGALRSLGWTGVCMLACLILGARPATVAPAVVPLLAAGSVALAQTRTWPIPWLRRAAIAFMVIFGLAGLPLSLPLLSAELTSRYGAFLRHDLGVTAPLTWDDGQVHDLPQDFAEMLGWDSQVATVSLIYSSLPPEIKEQCVILAADRGQAGAVNVLGRQYHLPRAVSPDGDYYSWGPGPLPGEVLIAIGMPAEALARHYDVVETAASVVTTFARQDVVHVLVCAQPRAPLSLIWGKLRAEAK